MADNIETIDLDKKGMIDMSFFQSFEQKAKAQIRTCNAVINIMGKSIQEMINMAELNDIDFMLDNIEFVNGSMEERPDRLPSMITFIGKDSKYEYTVTASPKYISDESEYPEEIMALLLKTNPKNPIDDFYVFNFQDKKWLKTDYAAHNGLTREQYELILNSPDDPRLPLFGLYKDFHGPMTNEEFDDFFEKNKQMVELFAMTSLYAGFDMFLMSKGIVGLSPLPSDINDGMSVTYEDGAYNLNITSKGQILKVIAKIENVEEMAEILSSFLDRKFEHDILSLVPLSVNSAAIIHVNGKCECMHLVGTDITEEEEKNFRLYVDKCINEAHKFTLSKTPDNINVIDLSKIQNP